MSRSLFFVVATTCLGVACSGDDAGDGRGPGVVFTVDTWPEYINTTPYTLSGTRPEGWAVWLDGAEAVAAGGESWSVDLGLNTGPNNFDVQPAEPDGTLGTVTAVTIHLDPLAPTVTETVPADSATGVPLNTSIRVVIDEPIDCGTVDTSVLVGGASGSVTCTNGPTSGTVELVPAANLSPNTPYDFTLLPLIADRAGNRLAAATSWSFTSGTAADSTPPANPALTSTPTSPTDLVAVQASGTKDASEPTAIEARWLLDGTPQNGGAWIEVVPVGGATTWTGTFDLLDGINRYFVRARDAAGNLSCGAGSTGGACNVEFTVEKRQNLQNVDPPTVTFPATTGVPRLVLFGTKPADTGLRVDGTVQVPRSGATDWYHEVALSPGANAFALRAEDAFGNLSPAVPVNITYTQPARVDSGAELKVDLLPRDLWPYIGDEFPFNNCGGRINHFSVEVWLEGPFATLDDNGTPSNPSDDTYEPCVYDTATRQRRFTRYTATLMRTLEGDASRVPTWELWVYTNWLVPNQFAALIESGHWNTGPTPIVPDVDRRDAQGHGWWWVNGDGRPCPPTWWWNNVDSRCEPRWTNNPPAIDGMTQASINPLFNNQGIDKNGDGLGQFNEPLSYQLPLRDRSGQPLRSGAYLVNIAVQVDRATHAQAPGAVGMSAPYQWNDVAALDRETCWDDPSHDTEGIHRAEGILVLDGTPRVEMWTEKGVVETVDAPHNGLNQIDHSASPVGEPTMVECDWDGFGSDTWCGSNTNDFFSDPPHCPMANSMSGATVTYIDGPVRVEYCPSGCP